ncbi:MAG: DUF559 domain-containing protein [Candidatus Margulisiibacteriota bacterium]|jgi:very-short-patch-repair endonuclease
MKKTKRGIIPYDVRLTPRAKKLRRDQTEAEKILWEVLRGKKVNNYKFIRQKPLGRFIVDFYCSKLLLGIEVDGSSHNKKAEYDEQRTVCLARNGIKIIRYWNEEIFFNLGKMIDDLNDKLAAREKELKALINR